MGRHSPPRSGTMTDIVRSDEPPDVLFFDRASKGIIELATVAREAGTLVIFEPSTAGVAHLFRAAVALAHIVKYSSERAGAVEAALPRKPNGQIRVVTKGASGLSVSSRRGWRPVAPFRADAVDTAGAGDWTTAAFLSALPSLDPANLDDEAVRSALTFGQAMAAMSCSFVGARGMALSWNRSQVLRTAEHLKAGGSRKGPREAVAGAWTTRRALLARLCDEGDCQPA